MLKPDDSKVLWRDFTPHIILWVFYGAIFIGLTYDFILHWNESYWLNNIMFLILLIPVLSMLLLSFRKPKHKIKRSYGKFFLIMIFFYAAVIIIPKYLLSNYPIIANNPINGVIATILIDVFCIVATILSIRIRPTYITEQGIRIGNDYWKNDEDIFLKQQPQFIIWNNIKEMKLKERPNRVSILYYLNIKTKKNEDFSCRIMRLKKFQSTIERLHKEKLLIKDFKYSKLRDSNISDKEREKIAEKMEKEDGIDE